MGGNWAKERSRGAARHPEKRKGPRELVSACPWRVRKRWSLTDREVGRREREEDRDGESDDGHPFYAPWQGISGITDVSRVHGNSRQSELT